MCTTETDSCLSHQNALSLLQTKTQAATVFSILFKPAIDLRGMLCPSLSKILSVSSHFVPNSRFIIERYFGVRSQLTSDILLLRRRKLGLISTSSGHKYQGQCIVYCCTLHYLPGRSPVVLSAGQSSETVDCCNSAAL